MAFEKPDRLPSRHSYEAEVWLPEQGDEPFVTKISKAELTIDRLDVLDFLEALEENPHPYILAPTHYTGEVGQCLHERYPYLELSTVETSKRIIIDALDSYEIGPTHIVEFMAQLAEAAGHIHKLGFVHRDLRPRNVFIDSRNHKLEPLIIDYGLITRPFFNLKTFQSWNEETPPEIQEESTMIDARYDVFQLGYMLRALTHEYSFSYNQWLAVKPVDRDLEEIMACAVGPIVQRYPDGEALADELRNYLRRSPRDDAAY